MNLNDLMLRRQEIETALVQTSNQYQILVGHKQEIEFQISELQKSCEDSPPVAECVDSGEGLVVE